MRIFVALDPVDMRRSFDALSGHVRRLHGDPTDGHLYFMVNKRRQMMKTLWLDRSGWCIFSKRLESGTFERPIASYGSRTVAIDATQLAMILEGVDLGAPRRRRYRPPQTPVMVDGRRSLSEGAMTASAPRGTRGRDQ